jgi:hypothetical protein
VQPDQSLDEREAYAQSSLCAIDFPIHLREELENLVDIFGKDADPRIANAKSPRSCSAQAPVMRPPGSVYFAALFTGWPTLE